MEIDIEEYYRQYGPMVLRRCRYFLKEEDKALDAMQDVFVKLIRYKDKLKGQYPSSLLYRMATNVCLNILRSADRKPETKSDELIMSIAHYDDGYERVEAEDLIDRVFEHELDSTKAIAVMHYVEKRTYAEIAEIVGLSVSGVRKRLRTLSERAKLRLEEHPDEA